MSHPQHKARRQSGRLRYLSLIVYLALRTTLVSTAGTIAYRHALQVVDPIDANMAAAIKSVAAAMAILVVFGISGLLMAPWRRSIERRSPQLHWPSLRYQTFWAAMALALLVIVVVFFVWSELAATASR